MIQIKPVVLCGGSGTRLWPLSRSGFPKQFLVLSGTQSLFQQAIARVNQLVDSEISIKDTLIVTGEEHRFLVRDQLREMPEIHTQILLEPTPRNTAPALTLAALAAIENGDDPILVVSPADQSLKNLEEYTRSLKSSVHLANQGAIVVLGILPDKPETGFGYIKGSIVDGRAEEYKVLAFKEKPDYETALKYLAEGGYVWNSGMFVLKASVWLNAISHFRSDIYQSVLESWRAKTNDDLFIRPAVEHFTNTPSESVDYAVIEKCPQSAFEIKMIPLDAGWSDLGAWDAVWKIGESDRDGNVIRGDAITTQTKNCYIKAESRLVGVVGVDDLIIIETADAVLVAKQSMSQDVKIIVKKLADAGRAEHVLPRKVHRPWGWFDSIDEGDRFKVKKIQVKPGASLSLQSHKYRAEHWVVVKGVADVLCGDKMIRLEENQSTYIPQGEKHRLSNPGEIMLEIIEVQSGSYFGEDDIVRFKDNYGR
jgi:mannose-1-phosphate guanylyltransferase/mannose-6-phosphate isomerase